MVGVLSEFGNRIRVPPFFVRYALLCRAGFCEGQGPAFTALNRVVRLLFFLSGLTPLASFVLAPLASNASELIASYNYAMKKTRKVPWLLHGRAFWGAAC